MSISKIIYDTIEAQNKQWVPKNHNPSSASFKFADGRIIGPDMLSQYLKWTGVKPTNPPGPKALLNMDIGNGVHDVLARTLAKAGIKAMSEVKGESPVNGLKNKVSYRVDSLIELDKELVVLEVKSSTDQTMFGKGWGIQDKGPKEDHILQLVCYLNLVPGVKRGILLYVSRDTGELLEYTFDRSYKTLTWDGIISRWKELEGYLDRKETPKPDRLAWLNDSGDIQEVKTIKGKRYKTPWRINYDSYRDAIWKNSRDHSLNKILDELGIEELEKRHVINQ